MKKAFLSVLLFTFIFTFGQSKHFDLDSSLSYKFKFLESNYNVLKKQNTSLVKSNKLLLKNLVLINQDLINIKKSIKISSDSVLKIQESITNIDSKTSNNFQILSNKNSLFIAIILITFILIIVFSKWLITYLNKLNVRNIEEVDNKLKNELNKVDLNVLKIIENQLNLIKQDKQSLGSTEISHNLTLKVGDEIHRMKKRIENMPKETKGLTALFNSLNRLVDEFKDAGYEFEELLGRKYIDGMKLEARFIDNPDIPKGDEIITDVLKPQINYKGVVIQTAKVEVSKSY
jgi:hypothetical protein